MRRCILLVPVLVFALGLVQSIAGQDRRQADDNLTVQELLTEVRMLRQALQTLQRMSLDTYRSQLLVDRIRVNREDVRRLAASLNETRDQLAKTQATIPQFIDRQKLLENRVQSEIDPNKRADLEFELKRTKDGIELYKSQIEPLKEREQNLTTELQTERAKLEDLESRLDRLERSIEDDRARLEGDKSAPDKKP
jgi:predicted  nucleic acid-binding Zn-ribbon protein